MTKLYPLFISLLPLIFTTAIAQADMAPLIKGLQSEAFLERAAANAKLQELGPEAAAFLAKGADHDDIEVATACQSRLKDLLADKETSAETRKNLSELEEGAAGKRLLADVPDPTTKPRANRLNQQFLGDGAVFELFGDIELNIEQLDVGGAETVQSFNINGKKTTIRTKGDDITMEYTNEKGEDVKVEADSKKDLKKKDPEAFKLYKELGGGIGRNAGGFQQFKFEIK